MYLGVPAMGSSRQNEIWIADDNDDVRLFLERAFKRLDLGQPVFFSNGAELLAHFEAGGVPPKVLLLDLQMPVMDGLSALNTLRQRGQCAETPVLIFSSLENPEVIRAAYSSGAKLYLKKPLHLTDYEEVAKLCALCAEEISKLSPNFIPFGALDVKRVFELISAE